MSKIKKKPIDRSTTTVTKKDINFEKILQFAGLFFLIAFSWFIVYWIFFDVILNKEEIVTGRMHVAYLIFTAYSAVFCFALTTKTKKNRDRKKSIFVDWLIAEFFFCVFAIFVVAIYIW